jgi:putative colanic acid biosynthesis UDP-glucose lipid carrier transferase
MHAFAYFLAIVMVYLFFYRRLEISRWFIIASMSSIAFFILMNRFCYLMIYQYAKRKRYLVKKVLILGYNDTGKRLANYLEEELVNVEIVGFCDEEENIKELSHYPILGSVAETLAVSEQNNVHEIYSTIAPEHDLGIYKLMKEADNACIGFKLVPDLGFFIHRQVHIDYLKDMPMLSVRKEPLQDIGNRAKKRALDIVISLTVIVLLLSWLIPLLGLLIFIESPGPIFFRQARTGRNRKQFMCYKFRSMKVNKDSNLKQASRNDNRLTRIGKFIRKTNLDEFPQFFNVLKGEMSLVGPRPHMLKHTDDYSAVIDGYMVRQFLKPGITGWAQINGYRGETKTVEQMRKRVKADVWYMENWSLFLDLRIMFLTFWQMVKGDKNAF